MSVEFALCIVFVEHLGLVKKLDFDLNCFDQRFKLRR